MTAHFRGLVLLLTILLIGGRVRPQAAQTNQATGADGLMQRLGYSVIPFRLGEFNQLEIEAQLNGKPVIGTFGTGSTEDSFSGKKSGKLPPPSAPFPRSPWRATSSIRPE